MKAGSVRGLAWRPDRKAPPLAADTLRLLPGVGIADDVHAHPHSPRQLLLADSAIYAGLSLPPHALRENLLLDLDTACLASGTVLQVGAEVRLRMMFQCEACGQLDAVQPRLAARIGNRRGVLARVLAGGVIHAGDPVHDLGVAALAWSDDWRERVARVLAAVPDGAVVEYRTLAHLAGIQSSYCRAFPRVLAKLGEQLAGKAVPAHAPSGLPRWHGDGLFDQS
jgi:hypothetical protein